MGVHDSVTGQEMETLFARAQLQRDVAASVLLDLRVYMVTIDLAVELGWRYPQGREGRELFRHVSRLALSRFVDPALWSACRSCGDLSVRLKCCACRGTGSLLIDPAEFERQLGGQEAALIWRGRIEVVSDKISAWANGRVAA